MAASTADRTTATSATVDTILSPIAASTIIYLNCFVCYDANGNIVLAADVANYVLAGYATQHVDNSAGSAGALSVAVRPPGIGVDGRYVYFDCSGATQAWVGTTVYFTDDHTVAQSSSHSVKAGVVVAFLSATQVLVDIK